MNKLSLTIRFLLFCLFFLVGASAIVLSILAHPELENYYHNRAMLDELRQQNQTITQLTTGYDARIKLIETEPNILARFSTAAFGQEPEALDTVFPKAANESLRSETERILKTETQPAPIDPIPTPLARILEPKTRRALFLAGTALVLITFIFFGTPRQKAAK
ncbi:MAG: hypothetical protein H8E73_07335 [Planctomycetes bacterium]|nr:hypothetical protein [Planctomycetota bacterium]